MRSLLRSVSGRFVLVRRLSYLSVIMFETFDGFDEFDTFDAFDSLIAFDEGDRQRRADGDRQRRADYEDPTTEKWAQVVVGSDKDAGAEASERRDGVEEEEAVA